MNLLNKARFGVQAARNAAIGASTALVSVTPAFAQTTGIGDGAVAAIEGAGSQVTTVGVAIIGVVVILLVIAFVRRAMGK